MEVFAEGDFRLLTKFVLAEVTLHRFVALFLKLLANYFFPFRNAQVAQVGSLPPRWLDGRIDLP